MKRMKKAVLNKAEGRTAHKFQFELKLTSVGALERVLKGLDGSALFVQATRCGSTRRVVVAVVGVQYCGSLAPVAVVAVVDAWYSWQY